MKKIFVILAFLALSACAAADDPMSEPVSSDDPLPPQSSANFSPQPADSSLRRENASVLQTDLLVMESFPLQFTLTLQGELPTPCNQLRVAVSPPDAQNKIAVDVYSVIDPNVMCAEVIQPFEANLPLGSFPAGHYTLWLNGTQISEFDA